MKEAYGLYTYNFKIWWLHKLSEYAIKPNSHYGYLLYQQSHTF